MPGRGRRGPAGQVRERDRDGILEVVRQPAEPGAEHDPDLGHEVGVGPHRGHQGGQTRGLFDGRDRARRVDRGRTGHRGLHYASRVDGRGRWLLRPDGSIDTGMPITSRRARACQAIVVRRRPGVATKRPKRPAAEQATLDVIAGPSILSAPSGKTYVRVRRRGRSTRLSTNSCGPPSPPSTTCSPVWISLWRTRSRAPRRSVGQPPIANISIRGRLDVASERSSE